MILTPARNYLAGAYADFVRTFSNVLFAVSLFFVWGILTLIGVIVDQSKDPSLYFEAYPAPVARLKGSYRFHFQLSAVALEDIQQVWRAATKDGLKLPANVEFAIDMDPINLR